ncbi:cadmium transporter [Bacillus sp. FJAT-27916]|uniref:heavy metal translocating P-type ATPase n=1 Tax=Bacillaceae TaxID=186817 RepID=UPI000670A065|nr:heavy metal translocating P-type ATPase [Bacillus sp. FJAT-27916]KMY45521.1 cadmium transporter [Bacillus sp. FJAT-27916]
MAEHQLNNPKGKTFRIEGLSCANCAKIFEDNVKNIDGVTDAKINFGASKIYVEGAATVEEIERAGAFEHLKIRDEKEKRIERVPFWKQKENWKVYASAFILLISLVLSAKYGEGHIYPTIGFFIAIALGGSSLFWTGLKNLSKLIFDMNTLMTIAIIGAAIIGEWREGGIVVILFAISEAMERYSMDKARQSIELLMNLAPSEALIRRGNQEMILPVDDIELHDVMIVKPGQKVAMDGVVKKGSSSLNQAAITGESIAVHKSVGDEVYAGTLNEEGLLEIEVTKRVEDTTIAKIIQLVEDAQAEKAPSQAFVDKFAKYYTPAIMAAAFLIMIVPPLLMDGEWGVWIYQGLAALVVGCPCALIVSTPVAVVTAIGNAARNGVLIKGGIHLEEAGHLKVIAFDKTGTLTEGKPAVTDIIAYDSDEEQALSIAAAIEKGSAHPLAAAIVEKAKALNLDIDIHKTDDVQSITGKGISAVINGNRYYVGSPGLFKEKMSVFLSDEVNSQISGLQAEGKTVMILASDDAVMLLIAVSDRVRESAGLAIDRLHRAGIEKTVMLTGDNTRTAEAVAKQVGVTDVRAELLPEEKLNFIKDLRKDYEHVAMIGDGVNDAPALAAASVGVAMGGAGTDTALETADIALMADDLDKLPYTIKLSRKALKIIKQNITFSLAIKALALVLVIPGWLTLWIAIFADMGATLIVTLNSMRLLRVKVK